MGFRLPKGLAHGVSWAYPHAIKRLPNKNGPACKASWTFLRLAVKELKTVKRRCMKIMLKYLMLSTALKELIAPENVR